MYFGWWLFVIKFDKDLIVCAMMHLIWNSTGFSSGKWHKILLDFHHINLTRPHTFPKQRSKRKNINPLKLLLVAYFLSTNDQNLRTMKAKNCHVTDILRLPNTFLTYNQTPYRHLISYQLITFSPWPQWWAWHMSTKGNWCYHDSLEVITTQKYSKSIWKRC